MIAVLLFVWYVIGLAGSVLTFEFQFRRNRRYPLDIDVADIIFGCVVALLGPFNFLIGCMFFIGWTIGGAINTNRVVFRKHTQNYESL